MASLAAQGENNRLLAVAVGIYNQLPDEAVNYDCKHITFTGRSLKGEIDAIDVPHYIHGAKTVGTYSVLEVHSRDRTRSTESYNYTAIEETTTSCKSPLIRSLSRIIPPAGQRADRARRLLTDSVAAVRSARYARCSATRPPNRLPAKGQSMTTAAMVAYAGAEIDQARVELGALSNCLKARR